MPGCQSYALTSRSRSPLLLALPQQTMNWEWKSVGKQGKYEKAPLWAWKKPLKKLFFLIITLQGWGWVSYTQSQSKSPLKYRKKRSFLPQEWKAGPLLWWKGGGRREGAELGWRGKGEPQRARLAPPTNEARDTPIPPAKPEAAACTAFRGSGTGRGVISQPFPSAARAYCLLFLCFNPASFTWPRVKFVICVSV